MDFKWIYGWFEREVAANKSNNFRVDEGVISN